MDDKIITVLLIATIIVSIFSVIVTLSLNTEDMQVNRTTTIIKEGDASAGSVGLVISQSQVNENG